ncbi:MAG: ZIP family metal transporter [Amphiplicatus sp.]
MLGDPGAINGFVAACVAAVVSTVGLVMMAATGDWGRRNSAYFSAFAVGILLVAVFFHLIPEALSLAPNAWRWVIVGLGVMSVIGVSLRTYAGRRAVDQDLAFGYASIIALGSHSFMDGVLYQTAFHDTVFTGWLATFALLLHEFPEGVIAYFLLREAGMETRPAVIWAFFTASMTTPLGAVGGAYVIDAIPGLQISTLLALTAGGLIYLLAFHLGPHAALTPNGRGYLFTSIGVVIGVAAVILHTLS